MWRALAPRVPLATVGLSRRACTRCDAGAVTNLCPACASALERPPDFVVEQLWSSGAQRDGAVLLDAWGRAHRLGVATEIGRAPAGSGLTILVGEVSRRHATVRHGADGRWQLRDEDSANGSFVNGLRVAETVLASGDKLTFGGVGVYFVLDVGQVVDDPYPAQSTTVPGTSAFDLRLIELIEAPSGGGGYLTVAGRHVRLPEIQLAFVRCLAQRMLRERSLAAAVRGYVPIRDLIAGLPWTTSRATPDQLKQLAHRLRLALDGAGIASFFTSRRGHGYRLTFVPSALSARL